MSISRLTRERLYKDEKLFNELIPFNKYDDKRGIFVHVDASLWSLWELEPKWITSTSDASAFDLTERIQEMIDALDHTISVQFTWITTFDVEDQLRKNISEYPTSGVAGWMARRWTRMLRRSAQNGRYGTRPRRLRLVVGFRYDPPWRATNALEKMKRAVEILFRGKIGVSAKERQSEYIQYTNRFRGIIEGTVAKLADLGFRPRKIDGQGIIDLLYPLLNRRSVKAGKFRRGKNTSTPVPRYDADDFLANQISETHADHPESGIVKKDGRYYRTVSLVKSPKQALPLMLTSLQSSAYENMITVTFSKDSQEKQMQRLDTLDGMLGLREVTGMGRANQKIQHQIASIRAARSELYGNKCQIGKVGIHQTFICQTKEEAVRAAAESLATFPQMNGARGMVHTIADLGVMMNTLPGCYDPGTDGPGWTNTMRSSRAVRMFPLWGNWKGSKGNLFVLPSLWNRELVGFDFYDSDIAPNVLISGVSGAGKSYLLCYLLISMNRGHYSTLSTGRMIERRPITFVFDKGMPGQPCGFEKVAQLFGGRIYEANPSKAPAMNFLARLGKTESDVTNEDYKDLIDISADIICDMATEVNRPLDRLDRAAVTESLVEAHRIYRSGPMKREFILSDVVSVLRAPQRVNENEDSTMRRQRVATLIGDYYGSGIYASFFDRPGSLELNERFIVFDLKALSRNPDLQRIFLKIAMLWADTVMNDPKELDTRKILVFDEAHDLIGKSSSATVETAFRLYRKRKGIVIAASQSGEDFYSGEGGQAIVQNSAHKIFLRQDPAKFHQTAEAFHLSDQQAQVILRLRTVKGVESQFYMISDIGEGALVLPLEPSFYWASTNNGDDNQLFQEILKEENGDFARALEHVVSIAPNGAKAFQSQVRGESEAMLNGGGNGLLSNAVYDEAASDNDVITH